ncbi:MAG: hypothetical protein AAF483_09025 [Planctomycetota bacterium]
MLGLIPSDSQQFVSSPRASQPFLTATIKISISFVTLIFLLANSIQAGEIIAGNIKFADGKVFAESRITIRVAPPNRPADDLDGLPAFYANTDKDGNFKIEVEKAVRGTLVVIGDDYVDHDNLAWHTYVPDFDSTQVRKINATFENRGRIILRVFGQSKLPSEYNIHITCTGKVPGETLRLTRQLSPSERGLTLHGLQPGEYQISAYVNRYSNDKYKTTVTIGESEPFRALAKLQLPVFEFGKLKGKFLLPDGKTPAANESLWIQARDGKAGGTRFITNENGEFETGDLPTGNAHIRVLDSPTIAPTTFKANIEKGTLSDAGASRFQAREEVFSRIKGRFLYENGSAIQKNFMGGYLVGWGLNGYSTGILGVHGQFHASGDFQYEFESGRRKLKFDIEGTGMQFMGGGFAIDGSPKYRSIIVDVNAKPGELLEKNVTLRRSPQKLKILLPEQNTANDKSHIRDVGLSGLMLIHQIDSQTYWCYEQQVFNYDGTYKKQVEIENVPLGKVFVFWRLGGCGLKEVDTSEQHVVKIEKSNLGSIRVQCLEPESLDGWAVSVTASLPLLNMYVSSAAVQPIASTEKGTIASINYRAQRLDDGSILFPNLGPQEYQLNYARDGMRIAKTVRLKASENRTIALDLP